MRYLSYIFIQTGRNFKQTWGAQLMTMLAVSLSVLIFCFFFLIYTNILQAGVKLGDDLRLILYLDEEVVPEMQDQLEIKITDFSEVEKIVFVSRQDAFDRLAQQLGENKDILDDLGSSFLPPSIEVYPRKSLRSLAEIKRFSDYLATLPGASKVQYGHGWVERFGYFTNLLRIIVLLSGVLLVLTTVFMVSYTIRLTMVTRQAELELLRLMGASKAYIQTPLMIEGFLQGILGSSLGLASLFILYNWIKARFSGPGILNLIEISFFPPAITAAILLTSIGLCASGSVISIRKFLRI